MKHSWDPFFQRSLTPAERAIVVMHERLHFEVYERNGGDPNVVRNIRDALELFEAGPTFSPRRARSPNAALVSAMGWGSLE